MHRPVSMTTTVPAPFRPNSPDQSAHQGSQLHQRLSSIRSFIAREQLLFGDAKVNRGAVEERVEQLRQHDEDDKKRVDARNEQCGKLEANKSPDATSPSTKAAKAAALNENGFNRKGWIWDASVGGSEGPMMSFKSDPS